MVVRLKLAILFFSTLIVTYGLVGGLMDRVSAGDEVYRDLSIFSSVLSKVKSDYVESPDMERALKGALHGMMEALDPFSSFVDAATYQQLSSRGDDAGIGVTVSKRYGYAYVVSVGSGSPGDRGGLRTGDFIESIDGKPSALMSLWESQRMLSGPDQSQGPLRVLRSRATQPQELTLTRAVLQPLEVDARVVDQNIGLLVVPHFREGTGEVVRAKLKMLQSRGVDGLIVDVRGSAEGAVEEADGGTSGVGEIFAAALQDNEVADLVGQRTNGQGSLQERFSLEDGSVIFVSTQMFYRPTAEPIQGEDIRRSGLKPGLVSPDRNFITTFYLENTPEDLDRDLDQSFYLRLDEAIQLEQLESGLDHLKQEIENFREVSEEKVA